MLNIKWIGANANNYQVGRGGKTIKYVVLHWIVGTLESADATFQKPDRIASATYGIGDNEIHQWVKEADTSYANGNLTSNRESITIEHEGGWKLPDGTRFKPTQQTHETSAQLVADICKRYNIPIDRNQIKKHNDISATECPGSLDIDWIINRAKEINSPPATPTFTAQTKIPVNTVTALETYTDVELGALRSMLIAKDQSIKDLKEGNKIQAGIIREYQTMVEDLNNDLAKVIKDFKSYQLTHPEPVKADEVEITTTVFPKKAETHPKTPFNLIQWLKDNWAWK